MDEATQIITFLEDTIKAGATKAYLTKEEYDVFSNSPVGNSYQFRKYRKTNPRGVYKHRLTIMVSK